MIFGLIPAWNEVRNIGPAIASLFEVGCDRVVVLDGAYLYEDGASFLNGGRMSDDGTVKEAMDAGATVIVPGEQPRFGQKRELLLRMCGAQAEDFVLFLDADERAVGKLPELTGHSCVLYRNLKPNDLPDMRETWPHGDGGDVLPHFRLLRWSPTLTHLGFGDFMEDGEVIEPYDHEALAQNPDDFESLCRVALLDGIEIHHATKASPKRVSAKRRAYAR